LFPSLFRAYRYTGRRQTTKGEERQMHYAYRGYWIAHVHSRTKEAFGRAYRGESRDDQAKEEHGGAPERFGTGGVN
jgi:hypothetical protein